MNTIMNDNSQQIITLSFYTCILRGTWGGCRWKDGGISGLGQVGQYGQQQDDRERRAQQSLGAELMCRKGAEPHR